MITKDNAIITVDTAPFFLGERNPIYIDFRNEDEMAHSVWLTPQEALVLAEELTTIAHKASKDMETK